MLRKLVTLIKSLFSFILQSLSTKEVQETPLEIQETPVLDSTPIVSQEVYEAARRVRKVVQNIAPNMGRAYNDRIKYGRSLKWYGPELATILNKNPKFDNLVRELSKVGINVIVKKTEHATRLHIKRRV